MLIIQRTTHCKGILESIDQTLRVSTPKKSLSDSLPPLKKKETRNFNFLPANAVQVTLWLQFFNIYPNNWLLMINLRIIFEDFQMGNCKHAVLALDVFVAHLFPWLLCQNFRFDTRK